ncbi:MAG: DNA-binding protein HmvA [Candidatus Micrarchaeota archaeon]|nr:MAG: DNA-binding protein HmvA [Candidatus Micrarchaeota archaeon]
MVRIKKSTIKKIVRSKTRFRVSDAAINEMKRILEDYFDDILNKAIDRARKENRKYIKLEDIK